VLVGVCTQTRFCDMEEGHDVGVLMCKIQGARFSCDLPCNL
jgi:hypothetical protein